MSVDDKLYIKAGSGAGGAFDLKILPLRRDAPIYAMA